MDIALWIAQALLGVGFLAAGFQHAFRFEQFAANPLVRGWARDVGRGAMRRIGILEMAGAIGVTLAVLTGILPWLMPLAATGLGLVMLSAAVFHFRRGEYPAIASNAVLGALAAFVAVGRAFVRACLVVVPTHVVDRLRALVLGMGLSTLHPDGGLSCSIVRPSSRRSAGGSWSIGF